MVVPRDKIERALVRAGPKSRELVQRGADDPAKAWFADPAEPDKRLAQVTNWLDRLIRTRIVDFVDHKPQGEPQLAVELLDDKKPVATVKLWPAAGDAMAVVESSAYPGPVTIPRATADTLLKDVDCEFSMLCSPSFTPAYAVALTSTGTDLPGERLADRRWTIRFTADEPERHRKLAKGEDPRRFASWNGCRRWSRQFGRKGAACWGF